jgi:hypothetical protein
VSCHINNDNGVGARIIYAALLLDSKLKKKRRTMLVPQTFSHKCVSSHVISPDVYVSSSNIYQDFLSNLDVCTCTPNEASVRRQLTVHCYGGKEIRG